jgi:import inner membrane translocase subunit TIM50
LKDLSFLNRDLGKVLVIDNHQECLATHPENGLLVKSWKGEKGDTELFSYAIALQGINNVSSRNGYMGNG